MHRLLIEAIAQDNRSREQIKRCRKAAREPIGHRIVVDINQVSLQGCLGDPFQTFRGIRLERDNLLAVIPAFRKERLIGPGRRRGWLFVVVYLTRSLPGIDGNDRATRYQVG